MGSLLDSLSPAGVTAVGNVGGGLLSGIGNLIGQSVAFNYNKKLYDYQTDYKKLMDKMTAAGITPAAAAQGLSGVSPSMPSVSSGSMPDMSNLGSAMVNAEKVPSEINKNIAESEYNDAKTKELIQQMQWNPQRWQATIDEQRANIQNLGAQSKYYGSLKIYYDEFAENLKQKRPWEIKQLKQGLVNMRQEVLESMSREHLNYQSAYESQTRQELYRGNTRFFNSNANFLDSRTREQDWRNSLFDAGWNPDQKPWDNVVRLGIFDPQKAEVFLNNAIQCLDSVDSKMQEHYNLSFKGLRNAFVLDHLFKRYNDFVGTNIRGLGAFMPFLGGLGSSGVSPSFHSKMEHGHYWDDDSYFDYHNYR